MMTAKMFKAAIAIAALGIAAAAHAPAAAHHSVPVNFIPGTNVEVAGEIVAVQWVNPHSQITLEVTTDEGGTELWLIEWNAINTIRRHAPRLGFSIDDFVVGEMITIGGWEGRNGNSVYFRNAVLQKGKKIVWTTNIDPDLQRID